MDELLERNKNLNRGFRKLRVWREAIDLYVFEKKVLGQIRGISFKIKDQILASDPQITQITQINLISGIMGLKRS